MKALFRLLALAALAALALQFYFLGRIALMTAMAPESTAFQRSEAYRVTSVKGSLQWRQQWVPYRALSANLKRAVIASEDATFTGHDGVDIEALEKAWDRNLKAEQRAEKLNAQLSKSGRFAASSGEAKAPVKPLVKPPKIVGGSTITQQLAKNLFLSGERTLLRKGQELVLTLMLETLLSKQKILEIYLNSVEWGEGVFGAEAAAQHYFRKPAANLSTYEAARLAVMLPRPRYFETKPNSSYLSARASTIVARMGAVEAP